MNTEAIRRRSNGTIDIDFYRQRALTDRAAVRAGAARTAGRAWRPVIAISILLTALWMMPPVRPTSDPTMTAMASELTPSGR
jgi:hypothetical protein